MGQPRTYTVYELEAESGFDKRTITYYISEGLLPKVGRRGPRTTYPQEFHDRLMFIRRCRDLQDSGKLRAVTLREIADVMQVLAPEEFRDVAQGQRSDDWIMDRFVAPDWSTSGSPVPSTGQAPRPTTRVAAPDGEPMQKSAARTRFAPGAQMASMRQRREKLKSRADISFFARDLSAADEDLSAFEPAVKEQTTWDAAGLSSQQRAGDSPELLEEIRQLLLTIQQRADAGTLSSSGTSGERLMRVPITDDIMISVRNISEADADLVEALCQRLRRLL